MALKAGDIVAGKYEILGDIGEGGFGQTYLGYDAGMDRHVAVKELLQAAAESDPEEHEDYRRRFRLSADSHIPTLSLPMHWNPTRRAISI